MQILSQPSSYCNLYKNYEYTFVDMENANNSLNYKDYLGIGLSEGARAVYSITRTNVSTSMHMCIFLDAYKIYIFTHK